MLFIKDKKGDGAKAPAPSEKDFTLVVSRTTDNQGKESVSEILVPEKGPDDGSRGLFIRSPKDITHSAQRRMVDVSDVEETVRPSEPVAQTAVPASTTGNERSSSDKTPGLRFGPARRTEPEPDATVEHQPAQAEPEVLDPVPSADDSPQGGFSFRAEPVFASDAQATSAPSSTMPGASSDSAFKGLFVKKNSDTASQAAAPVNAKRVKTSFFGGKKQRDAEKAPAQPVADGIVDIAENGKPARKPLFGSRKVKSADAVGAEEKPSGKADKPAKAAKAEKPVKPKKAPRRGKTARDMLQIQVTLDAEVVYFNVSREGLEQVPVEGVRAAASFSRDDKRFVIKPTTTYQQAVDIALSEGVGEDVRVINEAKRLKSMYATSFERINELPVDVGPGLLLLERIVARTGRPERSHIICLLLQDASSQRSLAVLYHSDPEGEIREPQVTMNPNNLGFTLAQYQSARGLGQDCPVLQITNEDLISVASELSLYSREALWHGIPLSKVLWSAVGVVGAVAVAASVFAGYQKLQLEQTRTHMAQLKQATKAVDRTNEELIASSLVAFGKLQSLDVARLSERAASLWVPRSTLKVDATANREEYTLLLPLTGGQFFNNRPSVLNQLNNEHVQNLLKLTPPKECFKSLPGVSGGVNVIQININCESPAGSTTRYRLD